MWGKLADSFGWLPGDLFDAPRDQCRLPVADILKADRALALL
jgi:hypothetical protein